MIGKEVLIFALFAVFMLFGCIGGGEPQATPTPVQTPVATPTIQVTPTPVEEETPVELSETYCSILSGDAKDSCFSRLANQEEDSAYCLMIESEDLKRICLTYFGDCESLDGGMRDLCLFDLAVSSLDATNCEQITNSTLVDECYSMIAVDANNFTLCYNLVEPVKVDNCMFGIIVQAGDETLCSELSDPDLQIFCTASLTYDAELCVQIVNASVRETCEMYIIPSDE